MDTLTTDRLVLEPLTRGHAEVMYEVLGDPGLYAYLDDGPPPSLDHLRGVYRQLEARVSPDGSELWLNWAVCLRGGGTVGFVQATVAGAEAWVHFNPRAGRDARGCRIDCADAAHDAEGRPSIAMALA